jgi:hypothetical protein
MKRLKMTIKAISLATFAWLSIAAQSDASMMGPGMAGPAITNGGSFGMMNGMAGAPVLGGDGTAYLVTYVPATVPGPLPSKNSFQSKIIAVTPAGAISSLTVSGIASRPVVSGNLLVASASLPDFGDYVLSGNFGSNPPAEQSTVYIVSLPFSASAKPVAVSLDGAFASVPVIDAARSLIWVTTTDYGNGMMSGSSTYTTMYGNYNFNAAAPKTYMYILKFDGTYTRVTLQ